MINGMIVFGTAWDNCLRRVQWETVERVESKTEKIP